MFWRNKKHISVGLYMNSNANVGCMSAYVKMNRKTILSDFHTRNPDVSKCDIYTLSTQTRRKRINLLRFLSLSSCLSF